VITFGDADKGHCLQIYRQYRDRTDQIRLKDLYTTLFTLDSFTGAFIVAATFPDAECHQIRVSSQLPLFRKIPLSRFSDRFAQTAVRPMNQDGFDLLHS